MTADSTIVGDFMVKGVVCAELWHPLAYLRQIMLANSFSFLPVKLTGGSWALISDQCLALALRHVNRKRNEALGLTLEKAIDEKLIEPELTTPIPHDRDVNAVLNEMNLWPFLVHHPDHSLEVIGIVTSFDLM